MKQSTFEPVTNMLPLLFISSDNTVSVCPSNNWQFIVVRLYILSWLLLVATAKRLSSEPAKQRSSISSLNPTNYGNSLNNKVTKNMGWKYFIYFIVFFITKQVYMLISYYCTPVHVIKLWHACSLAVGSIILFIINLQNAHQPVAFMPV